MDTKEYIESGILELYVYGLLSETENEEVTQMAMKHKEINDEIVSIEKAIVNLSTSFSPFLSAENFEKIKAQLELKHNNIISIKPERSPLQYMGWAAAVILLLGIGYQYKILNQNQSQIVSIENEKSKLQEALVSSEINYKQTQDALTIVRDVKNTIVNLGGQTVSPKSYAKIYYNKETQVVYVDAAGLPDPPEGMVYQIWALKLNPLTPTSIGLLENFTADNQRLFAVEKANNAEAFGITLEPSGGSKSPTMEQLYTLGKV
ncbi:anti-sigma factor [Flavobacterium psychrotolerans]|uniref:Anti-sigma factor n=1 Tax=Flavobacterium psychrotolerans TaxID=2169410 RepID=A0A2U1JIC8_9FLAO|nr:anti-sigma factor [Flavobacterium psychrotolerans]PWA04775.1 anti-sigma factor [Flavobacterium psychrotolerans]